MAKSDNHFIKAYSQGKLSGVEIWIDTITGVNYLFAFNGYAGGLTLLVDEEGKPIVTPLSELENQ